MSDAAKPQDEPSIEEILGSIRRIISEDDDDAATAAPPKASAKPVAIDDEEPLELTNKITDDGTIISTVASETVAKPQEPMPQEPMPVDDIDALFNQPSQTDDVPAAPAAIEVTTLAFEEPPAMTPAPVENDAIDSLLSDTTAHATAAVMAKLTKHTPVSEPGQDGVSIESIVRGMLKPMLKEWLDAHLPDLVQTMVQRELEKLSKRV